MKKSPWSRHLKKQSFSALIWTESRLCCGTTIPVLYFIFNLLRWRISWPSALCNLVEGQMAHSQCQSDPLDLDTGGGEFSRARQLPAAAPGPAKFGSMEADGPFTFMSGYVQTAATLGTLADTEHNWRLGWGLTQEPTVCKRPVMFLHKRNAPHRFSLSLLHTFKLLFCQSRLAQEVCK